MVRLLDYFLSLDTFGGAIELNFKGKKRFTTVCGSLISTFLYVTFLMYSLQQGLNFLNRSDVSISNYEIVDLEGAQATHNFTEQRGGVIFRVENRNMNITRDM